MSAHNEPSRADLLVMLDRAAYKLEACRYSELPLAREIRALLVPQDVPRGSLAPRMRTSFDAWWRTTTYGASRQHVAWESWKAATIAASPDLLQMLHECAEYIAALNGEQDDYCQRARALIARATGEVK